MRLILYSTDACHLCEQARLVINRAQGVMVTEIDIAEDDHLLARSHPSPPLRQFKANRPTGM